MAKTQKKKAPKIRIKLKSYDLRMLESSLQKVLSVLHKSGAKIAWPIPLPKKRRLYTVLKANFVYKDAREQFERITYTRLIDIVETWQKTVENLQNLIVPVWVMVDIRVF